MPSDSVENSAHLTNSFYRLAPFIQQFIWKHGWAELRSIQVRAAEAAFDTNKHILLASGTASGKTEAAFLPVLTQLYNDCPTSVGALYIGPLKALINDQFLRLNDLCVEADIPVTAWHGDIGASKKHALLKRPAGVLQITPEALEGLLLNRPTQLAALFGDLRWVVIDEIHALMASDRGGQVLALLDRLALFALDRTRLPRRIGLSATLGDYEQAAAWLDGLTARGVVVVAENSGRTVNLLVDQFTLQPHAASRIADGSGTVVGRSFEATDKTGNAEKLLASQPEFFEAAFDATRHGKSIIFVNRRNDAEEMIIGLRRLAERKNLPDIYYVHHGSIAAALREDAELAMRDEDRPACTAATVTLELGIDLGQLDRVLQLGPTASVASFLQRLGRCGRRGQAPEMFFLLREDAKDGTESLFELIPWDLLQTIALIQLYAEEKWIEPVTRPKLPGSLLYQQTMSVIGAAGALSAAQLAERVLTLSPFQNVTLNDFRDLLHYLLKIDHLERTEEGDLILGLDGEQIVRDFHFLATFQDPAGWSVKDSSGDVGTVAEPVQAGGRFMLAGRTWEVVDLIPAQHLLVVKRIRGAPKASFFGGGAADVHDKILQRMHRVLAEDMKYPYLTERATARVEEARAMMRRTGLADGPRIVRTGEQRVNILPWCGSLILRTIAARINAIGSMIATVRPFYIDVKMRTRVDEVDPSRGELESNPQESRKDVVGLESLLAGLVEETWDPAAILNTMDRVFCERAKYDRFLPEGLLKRTFASQYLDMRGAHEALAGAVRSLGRHEAGSF